MLTLSCALGWVVAKISLKLKNKSFITVLVSLVFFGGLLFLLLSGRRRSSRSCWATPACYGERIQGAAYPLYLFGQASAPETVAAMAVVSAVVLALFAVAVGAAARSFLKIATSTGRTERRALPGAGRRRGALSRAALLGKELARFTASPNYMLNCGLGSSADAGAAGAAAAVEGRRC